MSERFIKYIPSEFSRWLMANKPFAFLLLTLIADRARRSDDPLTGLKAGQAFIGDHKSIGATRGQYREALKFLCIKKIAKVDQTCRTRKKTTTGTTTVGTKVTLCDSSVWEINSEANNHRNNHPTTTEQPPNNHEQERSKKEERMKKKTATKESITVDFADSSLPPLFYECLRTLPLTDKQKEDICNYDEDVVIKAVKHVTAPGFKIKKTLIASIIFFCKTPPEESLNLIKAREYIQHIRQLGFKQEAMQSEKLLEKNGMMLFFNGGWTTTTIKDLGALIQDIKDSTHELQSLKKPTRTELVELKQAKEYQCTH